MTEFLLFQGTLFIRVLVSAIFGGLIGAERQSRMKTAGVRTHLMVSMAAALMMLISKYGFADVIGQAGYTVDVSRVAASIITGMGILGGGLIFITKQGKVSGITTAAGVWVTVGIGMSIGAGMYIIGTATMLLVLLCQHLLHKSWLFKEPLKAQVDVVLNDSGEINDIDTKFGEIGAELGNFKMDKGAQGKCSAKVIVYFPSKYKRHEIVEMLSNIPEVESFTL